MTTQIDFPNYFEDIYPQQISTFFKLMSEEIRFKITFILVKHGEMCVSDLASALHSSVTTTSHHLQILKKNKVVTSQRQGKQVYYLVDNHRIRHFINVGFDFNHLEGENMDD